MKLQVCSVIDSLINNPKGQSIATCWGNQKKKTAKELVRRWNAFEDDGLVDGLVKAFKELTATFVGLPEGSIGGQAMKKAEAAIAKVT